MPASARFSSPRANQWSTVGGLTRTAGRGPTPVVRAADRGRAAREPPWQAPMPWSSGGRRDGGRAGSVDGQASREAAQPQAFSARPLCAAPVIRRVRREACWPSRPSGSNRPHSCHVTFLSSGSSGVRPDAVSPNRPPVVAGRRCAPGWRGGVRRTPRQVSKAQGHENAFRLLDGRPCHEGNVRGVSKPSLLPKQAESRWVVMARIAKKAHADLPTSPSNDTPSPLTSATVSITAAPGASMVTSMDVTIAARRLPTVTRRGRSSVSRPAQRPLASGRGDSPMS